MIACSMHNATLYFIRQNTWNGWYQYSKLRSNLKNLNCVAEPPKTGFNWAPAQISEHWTQACLSRDSNLKRGSNYSNSASVLILFKHYNLPFVNHKKVFSFKFSTNNLGHGLNAIFVIILFRNRSNSFRSFSWKNDCSQGTTLSPRNSSY